ncbi:hypothetical protein JX265_010745 [Neoarthrinium moseri]|uniref:Indoleamine 2,3-dioxygenase n=1 Tax=Neoarthrinium moseri TaxID=1658444 RepID=A0A9P9WDU3_9PEZI|nr:hypothetical protein JX265_010745 [Neoarthrinium moseri]
MAAASVSIPDPEQYGIGAKTGFLPPNPPLTTLPSTYYAPWEDIANNLPLLVREQRLRKVIRKLPVLETNRLQSRQEYERAHTVLSFLLHAYVWGDEDVATVVPPPLSIPFTRICQVLDLPTVAIYASVVLWNFTFIDKSDHLDFSDPAKLRSSLTFTGLPDESWFYMISAAIEARGAPIIFDVMQALQAALKDDCCRVIETLHRYRTGLKDIACLFDRMYEGCSPEHFCDSIRPFLSGWTKIRGGSTGEVDGLRFDMGNSRTSYMASSYGPSNAQCSLIQFFDVSLGVSHRPKHQTEVSQHAGDYLHDMRKYMPIYHRKFLEHVENVPNLRHFVQLHPNNSELVSAYDSAIAGLTELRDRHLRMVLRYINIEGPDEKSQGAGAEADDPVRVAEGTGGTQAVPFLTETRAHTTNAKIDKTIQMANTNDRSKNRRGKYCML